MTIEDLMLETPAASHGFPQPAIPEAGWRHGVELASPTADPLVWHDLTAYYAGDRLVRGAQAYQGKCQAAIADVTLVAGDDRLAPWNPDTSVLFGSHIELDAGLLMRMWFARVVSGVVVEWLPVWAGTVDGWGDVSQARGRVRIHVVKVVDTISHLVAKRVPSTSQEGWQERIPVLLGHANWRFGHDVYGLFSSPGPLNVLEVPDRDAQMSAIAELDQTCAPADVVWRSRRNGRLVFHPAPGSTFHDLDESGYEGELWENPLLERYPNGLVFSWNPDVAAGEIAYAQDDDRVEAFGLPKTAEAVRNDVQVTDPDGAYGADDPVSAARYGSRDETLNWIANNEPAVDRLLAARAYATSQAMPLTTALDLPGFWPAMAMADHLDPATIVHANRDDGPVATAAGRLRSVVEERMVRPGAVWVGAEQTAVLDWVSTVQADIDAVVAEQALLPVENLDFGGPVEVQVAPFEWTLPEQVIEPTHVQVRMVGVSDFWWDVDYPATSFVWGALEPETFYTFEVRLVRRVNGLVTHASAVRRRLFSTGAWPLPEPPGPTPGGDPGDTTVPLPELDDDCDVEWELQETDDSDTWTTVASGDQDHAWMEPQPGGGWLLNVPASEFDDGKLYRVRQREVCGGVPGTWYYGSPFDPPDDWEDPCTTPPALSEPPFDDPSLVMYVPKICAPDTITEAVSGSAWSKLAAFGELRAQFADGDDIAVATTSMGGLVMGGPAPGLTGLSNGDLTIHARIYLGDNDDVYKFADIGVAVQLTAVPVGSGFKVVATGFTGTEVFPMTESGELDLDTGHAIAVTYQRSTGTMKLLVEGTEVDDHVLGVEVPLVNAVPGASCSLPPGSWITDLAVWSSLVEFEPPIDPTPPPVAYKWDASDTHATSITQSGGVLLTWQNRFGSAGVATLTQPNANQRGSTGSRTVNGLNALNFVNTGTASTSDHLINSDPLDIWAIAAKTIFIVAERDGQGDRVLFGEGGSNGAGSQADWRILTRNTVTSEIRVDRKNGSATPTAIVTGGSTAAGSPFLVGLVDTGAAMTLRVDGVQVDSQTYSKPSLTLTTTTVANVSRSGNDFDFFDGAICEIRIYDSVLNPAQIATVEAELMTKWGV